MEESHFCISVHESFRTESFVCPFSYCCLVRIHAACLIVHGSIGECVVTAKAGILSLITAKYVPCLSGRHSFATLSGSNCRTPSLSPLYSKAFIPQVTHQLGCCCDNVRHVHLLGVLHHRRVDGSRGGICSHKDARYP